MSNLDMSLGDIVKANKPKKVGRGGGAAGNAGGRQQGGIKKGNKRQSSGAKQAGTTNQRQNKGGNAPSQKKTRQTVRIQRTRSTHSERASSQRSVIACSFYRSRSMVS